MDLVIDILCIILLIGALMFSKRSVKSWAIGVVLGVYLIHMRVQSSDIYVYILDYVGYYVSQSFFEWLVIGLLLLLPSKEAILIMGLCLFAVFVNIGGFAAEYFGHNPKELVESVMWVLFGLQLLILFSQGITDGLLRAVSGFSMVRDYCSRSLKIDIKG